MAAVGRLGKNGKGTGQKEKQYTKLYKKWGNTKYKTKIVSKTNINRIVENICRLIGK